MHKIYFYDRTIFLTDKIDNRFKNQPEIFSIYNSNVDLVQIIKNFEQNLQIKAHIIYYENLEKLFNDFKQFCVYIEAAGGVVKNLKGEILVINRLGKWDLPKGKIEVGEEIETAAKREVTEECGITNLAIVKPLISTYHTYKHEESLILKKTHWFEMKYEGNEPLIPQTIENIDLAIWVNSNKIKDLINNSYLSLKEVFNLVV